MTNDDKVYDLFDIDQNEASGKEGKVSEPTRRVPDRSQAPEPMPGAMQEFDFGDVIIDEQQIAPEQTERPVQLDLDGKPLGGSEEEQIRQERKDRRRKAGSILSGIFSWVKEIAVALIIVWVVITFVAQNNQVVGTSMQPTVYANDMVIVNKFIYRFSEPKRGDIIVFPSVENGKKVFLIKRIIGLPGDVVDIREGKVFVNDKELVEKYISIETSAISGEQTFPLTIPDKEYFVLGDNRIVSKDSRYLAVGTIPRSKIVGKASIRIWPFKSIGFIE